MKLNPKNPHHDPVIQPNYFEHPQDIIDLREAVKIARKIFAQKSLEPFRGPELAPGNIIISGMPPYCVCLHEYGQLKYHIFCLFHCHFLIQ